MNKKKPIYEPLGDMTPAEDKYVINLINRERDRIMSDAANADSLSNVEKSEIEEKALDKLCEALDRSIPIELSDKRTCIVCGANFNKEKTIPKRFWCPNCGQLSIYDPIGSLKL